LILFSHLLIAGRVAMAFEFNFETIAEKIPTIDYIKAAVLVDQRGLYSDTDYAIWQPYLRALAFAPMPTLWVLAAPLGIKGKRAIKRAVNFATSLILLEPVVSLGFKWRLFLHHFRIPPRGWRPG
jgi:hypothetical protein